jgi:hypothetical protein
MYVYMYVIYTVCVFTLVNNSTAVSKTAHVYIIKAYRRMECRSTDTESWH